MQGVKGSGIPGKRGRKPGIPKTGGRKKGAVNKKTIMSRKAAHDLLMAGITPLQVLIGAMRGEAFTDRQFQAAIAAAPYVHARLANTTINASIRTSITQFTEAELAVISGEAGEEGTAEPV